MPTSDPNNPSSTPTSGPPPRVVVLNARDQHPWPGLEPLDSAAEVTQTADADAFAAVFPSADILVVTHLATPLVRRHWDAAGSLQWIHATSAGVNQLIFDELRASDIPLTNAAGVFDRTIAEYVLGMMLAFCKRFPEALDCQRRGEWRHMSSETLEGKRLLVVGAGSIGTAIGRLAGAAGMEATLVARTARSRPVDGMAVHGADELRGLLPEADVVAIAAPLTPETRHLFDADTLACMPPHARLINVGRGAIVDTPALVDALQAGRLAGAGLDVFEEEPLPPNHPLWTLPNVLITAHQAGDHHGWQERLSRQFLQLFEQWRHGNPFTNLIDKRRGYASRLPE